MTLSSIPNWLSPVGAYAYLATPYGAFPGGLETAHDAACKLAARLIDADWPIFCPIAHTHIIAKHMTRDPSDSSFWINVNRGMLLKASGIVVAMMPTWRKSKGISIEIEEMALLRCPVVYLDPKTLEWSDRGAVE